MLVQLIKSTSNGTTGTSSLLEEVWPDFVVVTMVTAVAICACGVVGSLIMSLVLPGISYELNNPEFSLVGESLVLVLLVVLVSVLLVLPVLPVLAVVLLVLAVVILSSLYLSQVDIINDFTSIVSFNNVSSSPLVNHYNN